MNVAPRSIAPSASLAVLVAMLVAGCAQVYTLKVDPASRSLTPRNVTYFISATDVPPDVKSAGPSPTDLSAARFPTSA